LTRIIKILLIAALVTVAAAQSQQVPLSDSRLTVHTLLREDIFAGFMADDMKRFERGEKNIQLLLEQRPDQKGNLLAWKGGALLYRAVIANENKRADEFQRYYRQAREVFGEAQKSPGNEGVAPITGGSFALFADRLPSEYRAEAWATAYDNYQALYKSQAAFVDKLPLHLKGEVLAGVAQTAQRTGRKEESAQFVDKMLALLPGTPYEPMAKKWKANPESAANSSLTCMTCHDPGRLAVRMADLK